MITINVPCKVGSCAEIVYNVNDFPYEILCTYPTCRKSRRNTYYNIPAAFDIETTSIACGNGAFGFMYHWQFCIDKYVVFGRTWEEYTYFLNCIRKAMGLSNGNRLVVYVHNLAYEFQFMKDFIKIDDMFCKDKKKPIKVIAEGIEFRCSYFLSNMSLAKFCENSASCVHYKLAGTYDYEKVRTPDTKLNELELAYCYNDVRGLCECIEDLLKEDTIATMPLTNTGYVRRDYRNVMTANPKNRALLLKTALNEHLYQFCADTFRGGDTHANRFTSGIILENVHSYDIQSSYPANMAMDYFPIGKFSKVTLDSQHKLDYYTEHFCCLLDVEFFDIHLKEGVVDPYIDIGHCIERSNITNDNGRVLDADYIRMRITNIDLDIIRDNYDFEGLNVIEAYHARRGKLPIELIQKMMDFFAGKQQLKGVKGKEYEYMKSKNKLNSTFGMMVQAIVHAIISYTESSGWYKEDENITDALTDFYKNKNSFLAYQWGIFVTANARKRLHVMLDIVGEDAIYWDTDSIKFLNDKHIQEFEALNVKLVETAENNEPPAYVDRNEKDGSVKRFHLGIWDYEGCYVRFKTLGAKKYCVEKWHKIKEKKNVNLRYLRKITNNKTYYIKAAAYNHFKYTDKKLIELESTVSGMSKTLGRDAIGKIENFNIGRTFNNIGRITMWYHDEKPHRITVDGCTFTTASNIGSLNTTYTLGVTNEYWELIMLNDINYKVS